MTKSMIYHWIILIIKSTDENKSNQIGNTNYFFHTNKQTISTISFSVTTDDDVQQPQPEVYCNLCDRSFCNKYFLKTHLAKKHADINLPSSPLLSSSENNDQPKTTVEKSSEDYCEVGSRCFSNEWIFNWKILLDLSKTFL